MLLSLFPARIDTIMFIGLLFFLLPTNVFENATPHHSGSSHPTNDAGTLTIKPYFMQTLYPLGVPAQEQKKTRRGGFFGGIKNDGTGIRRDGILILSPREDGYRPMQM